MNNFKIIEGAGWKRQIGTKITDECFETLRSELKLRGINTSSFVETALWEKFERDFGVRTAKEQLGRNIFTPELLK